MSQDSVHHKTMITQVSVHFSLSTDYAGICTQPRFCDERRLNSSQNHGLGQTQFCDIFGGFPKRRPDFVAGPKTPTRFCGWPQNADPILWCGFHNSSLSCSTPRQGTRHPCFYRQKSTSFATPVGEPACQSPEPQESSNQARETSSLPMLARPTIDAAPLRPGFKIGCF